MKQAEFMNLLMDAWYEGRAGAWAMRLALTLQDRLEQDILDILDYKID